MNKSILICLALLAINSLSANDTCIYCGKVIKQGEKYMSRATYDTTKYLDEDYFDTEKIYYFHSKCGSKGEQLGIYPFPLAISIRYGAKIGIAFDKIEKKKVNRSYSKSRSRHNRNGKRGGGINNNQKKKKDNSIPEGLRGTGAMYGQLSNKVAAKFLKYHHGEPAFVGGCITPSGGRIAKWYFIDSQTWVDKRIDRYKNRSFVITFNPKTMKVIKGIWYDHIIGG